MKKVYIILAFLMFVIGVRSQNVTTLTFSGRDVNDMPVQLNSVLVTNHTQHWQEVLHYPDTVLYLGTTDIHSNELADHISLYQNHPNPFDGTTEFYLQLDEKERVVLEIFDLAGRSITHYSELLMPGTHAFKAELASPSTYLLSAKMVGDVAVIKMVNQGYGGHNVIKYLGLSSNVAENTLKKGTVKPYHLADEMEYSGTASLNGKIISSEIIKSHLDGTQSVVLPFVSSFADGQPCSGAAIVTDVDGNTYNTVQIGDQCWMKENLRTTQYADGTSISHGSGTSTTVGYWYYPDNISSHKATYGLLYNWKAVMRDYLSSATNPSGVQGICPTGWHVPSDAEWTQLTDYVSSQSQYQCDNNSISIAKALASNIEWYTSNNSCAVGNNRSDNNVTGFAALPAGNYYGYHNAFGYYAHFWSASEYGSNLAYGRRLNYNYADVSRYNDDKNRGISVRCLRDEGGSAQTLPTVTTSSVSNITATSASCGGNVTSDGGAAVIARGVCWSTTPNPTTDNNKTVDGIGIGSFISTITDLVEGTTYYVRAYATNSVGTAYGEEETFFTTEDGLPCQEAAIVSDVDGNIYNTVRIGDQCWMRENLRTTKYADGTVVQQGSTTSYDIAYWYYPNNNSDNKTTYGLLYNWKAVMRNASSSSLNPSGVQGICPTGWHVPSDAEWTQLVNYVSSHGEFVCGNNNRNIAQALSSTIGWSSSSEICAVGNDPSSNNATGFSVFPAGGYHNDYNYFATYAHFWSASENGNGYASSRGFYYNYAYVYESNPDKYDGFSIRCLRDKGSSAQTIPTVTSDSVSGITSTTAMCGGNVTSDGGAAVIARGVCWSTTPNPTTGNNKTVDGIGIGSFISTITDLVEGTTYYVRAYATNSVGTAYGEERSFTAIVDGSPCLGAATVTDIDTNIYNTVQIGSQCWMKENLRATHDRNGNTIGWIPNSGDYGSNPRPLGFPPEGKWSNVAQYGLLYNWLAALQVCPQGWHLPTKEEFKSLMTYCGEYHAVGGNNDYIAKALASPTGWVTSNNLYSVGNNPSSNNSTGFTAVSAGDWIVGVGGDEIGYSACFWSDTEDISIYRISTDKATVVDDSYSVESYCSVRCLRDEWSSTQTTPTVTSDSVSDITSTTAICGGNVTSDGGATVIARGVCWSISPNPTDDMDKTIDGTGMGSFTSNLTNLTPGTTYYVRAYATNSVGTSYGEERSFTTSSDGLACPGAATVTDTDGNTYNTVQIGDQCWMKENLRTTKYADGTSINQGLTTSTTVAYWYYPNGFSSNKVTYGLLYNWKAVMRDYSSSATNPSSVQGICPTGWHVPSDAEWTQLTDYVSNQSQYQCNNNNGSIAKALASTTGWDSSSEPCAVGNNQSNNNATVFSAVPAGNYGGRYYNFGINAIFWSATEHDDNSAYNRYLGCDNARVNIDNGYKYYGFSVRCLRDEGVSAQTLPTVTTSSVSNITVTSASCGGNVTSDGGATVIARGVCWSTMPNPTIDNNKTTDGAGLGSYTSSVTDLAEGTTYYVRAYATNSVGTTYGEEISFTTTNSFTCGTSTVKDIDNNTYNTVQIGDQCWMKKNLRTTKYADGTSINQGTIASTTTAYWYYPDNNSSNKASYGLLYNWKAVMRSSASSSANPSGVQGICPNGWHVPSDAEWTQLTNYVSRQSQYQCSGTSSNIAKALASTTGWVGSSGSAYYCTVGNDQNSNNATGFSAVSAGIYQGSYLNFGFSAYFWSATEYNGGAYGRYLNYDSASVNRYNLSKARGFSVRCLKD